MTAVAGILNKHGVAIAADSAVTVNGHHNRKVYNSANKIFTLSKHHPVGIAIYNNAQFMGVPWEVLIKEYRKQLEHKSFPKLEDYKNDFFDWLKNHGYFLQEDHKDYLVSDFISFMHVIWNEFQRRQKPVKARFQEDFRLFCDTIVEEFKERQKPLDCFETLDVPKVSSDLLDCMPRVSAVFEQNTGFKIENEETIKSSANAYLEYLRHDWFIQFSGLIFTGFGDSEIYPRLIPVFVSIVVDGHLKHNVDDERTAIISNRNDSCITPFAQTDVIDTILQGVSPELNMLSANVFGSFIAGFIDEIMQIPNMPVEVKSHLNNLKPQDYVDKYQSKFHEVVREKYVNPLMGAVSHLSKEDLAEMAESLVYLTYLKRRFTMAEESVGGPVDIAVITKGDGFIWIKRKHYFDPELNQSFFQKYLK